MYFSKTQEAVHILTYRSSQLLLPDGEMRTAKIVYFWFQNFIITDKNRKPCIARLLFPIFFFGYLSREEGLSSTSVVPFGLYVFTLVVRLCSITTSFVNFFSKNIDTNVVQVIVLMVYIRSTAVCHSQTPIFAGLGRVELPSKVSGTLILSVERQAQLRLWRESNPHLKIRSFVFYPLNYKGNLVASAKGFKPSLTKLEVWCIIQLCYTEKNFSKIEWERARKQLAGLPSASSPVGGKTVFRKCVHSIRSN